MFRRNENFNVEEKDKLNLLSLFLFFYLLKKS